jgi:hypothetical protein
MRLVEDNMIQFSLWCGGRGLRSSRGNLNITLTIFWLLAEGFPFIIIARSLQLRPNCFYNAFLFPVSPALLPSNFKPALAQDLTAAPPEGCLLQSICLFKMNGLRTYSFPWACSHLWTDELKSLIMCSWVLKWQAVFRRAMAIVQCQERQCRKPAAGASEEARASERYIHT